MTSAIVARAPTRLDFGGGWTDVPPYPEREGGAVCNIAITRYATASVRVGEHATHQAHHDDEALIRAAIRRSAFPSADATLTCDYPTGAGLGGSSAAGVALAGALAVLNEESFTLHELALHSRRTEVEELGIAGGFQDHFAAAFGGALLLGFTESVEVEEIPVDDRTREALVRRGILVYTGESRISAEQITAVRDAYTEGERRVVTALAAMKALAYQMADALRRSDIDRLGSLLGEHWTHQRALHPSITTPRIDAMATAAARAGGLGMKALGASGGGCVLVIAEEGREDELAAALEPLGTRVTFGIDDAGFDVIAMLDESGESGVSAHDIVAGDARSLLQTLVRIDSRNPSLVPGAPGERECAGRLRDVLDAWGFRTTVTEVIEGRPNVVARIGDAKTGRSLMFNGHLDVVGTEGMVHAPFAAEERDGMLYGRGAADMKGGIAAMCAAAWRAAQRGISGEIIIAAVIDEEFESRGTRALIEQGVRADGAIVTEPTRLAIMPAHRGFVWIEVEIAGHAAHGSRWDIGVDAIRHAGLLLAELDRIDADVLPSRTHALLGHPSLHASFIAGGVGMSTYPDRCVLTLERRTIPGESPAAVIAEVNEACRVVRERRPTFIARSRLLLAQDPSDVSTDAEIVQSLESVLVECNEPTRIDGMSAWTDAALLNSAGIPAICFGPGDISLAHAAEEYIALDEVDRATNVLAALAVQRLA